MVSRVNHQTGSIHKLTHLALIHRAEHMLGIKRPIGADAGTESVPAEVTKPLKMRKSEANTQRVAPSASASTSTSTSVSSASTALPVSASSSTTSQSTSLLPHGSVPGAQDSSLQKSVFFHRASVFSASVGRSVGEDVDSHAHSRGLIWCVFLWFCFVSGDCFLFRRSDGHAAVDIVGRACCTCLCFVCFLLLLLLLLLSCVRVCMILCVYDLSIYVCICFRISMVVVVVLRLLRRPPPLVHGNGNLTSSAS
jgi:hypothetical protein